MTASLVAVGFALGFLVAMQPGAMTLFLLRSTLESGAAVGIAIGIGIAAVDTAYAALGAAGAAPLVQHDVVRVVLGVLGTGMLAWLGARALQRAVRPHGVRELEGHVTTPGRAFVVSIAATAGNPTTIASWAAIFSAASIATRMDGAAEGAALVVGVGVGSATWVVALALATAIAHRRIGERGLRIVDGVAGIGLLTFAALLGMSVAAA